MKVKEFATVISGATPSSKCPEYYDGDIAWFTPKDLSDQGTKHVSQCERYITKAGYDSCSTTMLPAGSVLMSSRAPIGLLAIADVPCCTNQGFKSFDVDRSKCDPEYLYYYLKLHIKEVESLGSGTTFKEVSKESVENYDVTLPDLDVQQQIISVLRDIDSKIANNNAICSNLEAMAKLLYDYWFVQFDFPDENGKPYKSSGGKMVWNDELKREIPAGWEVKCISDIGTLDQNSVWPNNDMVYSHYSIPAFDDSHMPVREEGSVIESNKYIIPENCVLVSKLNPQFKRIWLIIKPQENAICSTEFLPIKAGNIGINYLYEVVNSDAFSVHLSQKASSSTGSRKRIDPENCMAFQFASDNRIAKLYNSTVASLIEQANQIPLENQQLASLRDFLLPVLMNGQVKVC